MQTKLIHKIEDSNIKFQIGSFFTKKLERPDSVILLNEELPTDPYLNVATKIKINDNVDKFINEIEKLFNFYKTIPSFYILPYTRPKNLDRILLDKGYKLFSKDAWMLFNFNKHYYTPQPHNLNIRRVKTNKELEQFIEIFNRVYTKGEPDDPYQGLSPLYGEFIKRRYHQKICDFKSEHYAAFLDGEIVGVGMLIFDKEIGGLYGLAVLPKFRNKGIGKALSNIRIDRARELKLKHLFLWTELGSRNEKIFNKLGFETKVIGQQFYKA